MERPPIMSGEMYEQRLPGARLVESPNSSRQPAAGAPARRAERAGAAEPLPSHALFKRPPECSAPVHCATTHRRARVCCVRELSIGAVGHAVDFGAAVTSRPRFVASPARAERVQRMPACLPSTGSWGRCDDALHVAVLVALVRLVASLSVATLLVAPASAAEPDSVTR